jgi:iron complex transport system substrate-binding protein
MSHRSYLRSVRLLVIAAAVAYGVVHANDCQPGFRPFQHAAGSTCVPTAPERIVTTQDQNGLLPLLELGVRPVGSAANVLPDGSSQFRRVQGFDTTGIAPIGSFREPSLEAIAALRPDLIVGHEFNAAIYDQLSRIAPTVLIQIFERPLSEVLFDFADLVGRTAAAEVFEAATVAKVAALQSALDARGGTISVSVITSGNTPDTFWRADTGQAVGTVMNHYLDVPRPAAQAREDLNTDTLSVEVLREHDADALLVFDFSGERRDEVVMTFVSSPLMAATGAGRAGQVFVIDGTLTVGAAWGKMNAFLDELVRILLDPTLQDVVAN